MVQYEYRLAKLSSENLWDSVTHNFVFAVLNVHQSDLSKILDWSFSTSFLYPPLPLVSQKDTSQCGGVAKLKDGLMAWCQLHAI